MTTDMENQTARQKLRKIANRTAERARAKCKDGQPINRELDELEDIIGLLIELVPERGPNENSVRPQAGR